VCEAVSNPTCQAQIRPYHFGNETNAVGHTDATTVRAEWLVVVQQLANLLLVINEKRDQDVFEQAFKKGPTDDHHRSVIGFVVEESGEFEKCSLKLEVPVEGLACDPEWIRFVIIEFFVRRRV
jgi:hypothetical protein